MAGDGDLHLAERRGMAWHSMQLACVLSVPCPEIGKEKKRRGNETRRGPHKQPSPALPRACIAAFLGLAPHVSVVDVTHGTAYSTIFCIASGVSNTTIEKPPQQGQARQTSLPTEPAAASMSSMVISRAGC